MTLLDRTRVPDHTWSWGCRRESMPTVPRETCGPQHQHGQRDDRHRRHGTANRLLTPGAQSAAPHCRPPPTDRGQFQTGPRSGQQHVWPPHAEPCRTTGWFELVDEPGFGPARVRGPPEARSQALVAGLRSPCVVTTAPQRVSYAIVGCSVRDASGERGRRGEARHCIAGAASAGEEPRSPTVPSQGSRTVIGVAGAPADRRWLVTTHPKGAGAGTLVQHR